MKNNKPIFFILVLLVLLLVFFVNMTFAGLFSGAVRLILRIVLTILFLSGYLLFNRKGKKSLAGLSIALMAVNLAFLVVSFFTNDLLGLSNATPEGLALSKLSDSLIISTVVIVSLLVSGLRLRDIYLNKGKLLTGLITGIISFLIMGFLALNNPEQPISPEFLKTNIEWILIFVFFNGFMEELIFRGIFLKPLNQFFKPGWSIVLTAIVFGVAHMQVTYTPDVLFFVGLTFVLGLIWGFLIYYTRSLLASVLFHAGADLVIIMPVYASFGVAG